MGKVLLGIPYKDPFTGYEGVATARTEYLGGEASVCLERRKVDGSIEETWWKEARLEVVPETHASNTGQYS